MRPFPLSTALRLLLVLLQTAVSGFPDTPWKQANGGRFQALAPAPGGEVGRTGFTTLRPADTGLAFTNSLDPQAAANNRILENGSGIALGDVDGDGLCDIYLCRLQGPNGLYLNRGSWRFEAVPNAGGAACASDASTGAVMADVDGDRDLDLLVNGIGTGTRLFLNDARGGFTESTNNRLTRRLGATSLALADLDGDGDLDLYVTNYRTTTFRDNPPGLRVEARREPGGGIAVSPADRFLALGAQGESAEILERGERDFLYLNRGGGDFAPVSWTQGTFLDEDGKPLAAPPTDWGLSVLFRDLDGDGWPDLYVCNDFVHWSDRVWLNRAGAGFQAAPRTWLRHQSLSSMAVDAADINRDGRDDLFVAEMLGTDLAKRAWQRPNTMAASLRPPVLDPDFRPEVTRNTLHLARDSGGFAEIAQFAGVAASDWTWSAVFLDVDLDGWEDLLTGNGNLHDVQHADVLEAQSRRREPPSAAQRLRDFSRFPDLACTNRAYRNRRDGTFVEAGPEWGFDAYGVTTAMALADLDNDGDLDVVVNRLNAPALLLRNDSTAPRISVRLRGAGANTRGIGSRITVRGGPVVQSQEMVSGGRYLSGDDAVRTFAATAGALHSVEVRWPGGITSRLDGIPANSRVELDFPTTPSTSTPKPPSTRAVPLFEDRSDSLPHRSPPPASDDFQRQPLLPRLLSREPPGVAVADLDADGHEDLLFGSAGSAQAYRNVGGRGFAPWPERDVRAIGGRNVAGLLAFHRRDDGSPMSVLAESNWRDGQPDAPSASLHRQGPPRALAPSSASSGALVLADLVGDSHPDLVVAGRAAPGRWPVGVASRILTGTADGFGAEVPIPGNGLTTGATAADFDGDGRDELVLATEFGPIRFFRRSDQGMSAWDPELRFTESSRKPTPASGLRGFWNGVTAADFDGDGRLDLVAGNWGWNFGEARIDPRRDRVTVLHGEFGLGTGVHPLLASVDPARGILVPWREWTQVRNALPFILEKAPDHATYGRTPLESLLGSHATEAGRLDADWFASTVFLNRGDHFLVRPLPAEAQWTPAYGISTADFDGDGRTDLLLTQNHFGTDAETSRQDAGLGLVLMGDGTGGFRPLGSTESGVRMTGEGRGSAVLDFDRDGRMDVVAAQVEGPAKLFRNRTAIPGWTVTLRGGKRNPVAIGAAVRAESGNALGAAHPVHAGSGWWSQDSPRVLLTGGKPEAVRVRWPGGRETRTPWPGDRRELEIVEPEN
jgi:enediyne biosynthesis protein E4